MGHPEVYIVILPAFGMYSEIIPTFARKRLFGHQSMIWATAGIAFLSFLVWVHHFFTMGNGALINSFFSISTMLIGVPTGLNYLTGCSHYTKVELHLSHLCYSH